MQLLIVGVCVCMCVCASHINMQAFSQRPRGSDRLSFTSTYFIGSSVSQLCSHSSEDPRPVNYPVTVDDGDTSLGLQSWSKIPCSFIYHDETISVARYGTCMCLCVYVYMCVPK